MSLFDRDNPNHVAYYEMWSRRLARQKKQPWVKPSVRKIEPSADDFSPENEG